MTAAHPLSPKARNVLLVLGGVAGLLAKRYYSGPLAALVHDHGGNVSASFAAYFVIRITTLEWRHGKLVTAALTALIAGLFEATDGFGVMTNVYDPADFAANVVGAGLALVVDALLPRRSA